MQGRLTPPNGRGVQFYLADSVEGEREFEIAKDLGLSAIEWVGDLRTPLFDEHVQQKVREVVARTGVTVRNMDLHEIATKKDLAEHPDELFEKICASLSGVDGGAVEVPLLEASSLLDSAHYEARVAALRRLVAGAQKHGVPVAVETDLPPQALAEFLA